MVRKTLDKTEASNPTMKSLHLAITLTAPDNEKKAHLLIKKTMETGFILQSVKTIISYEAKLVDGPEIIS